MSYKVYSIIVTYNALQWIEKCLNSLYASVIHTNIVIVDNCSSDNTVDYIKKKYPDISIIVNENNRGFGQANNQGIEYAYREGATHFFLCNQDLYVKPDTLQILIEIQNKYGLYVVSPLQMNGTFEQLDPGFYSTFVRNNNIFVSGLINSELADYYETSYVPAAAWMLSKECVESIGGFDPIFFHYGEDNNYLHRVLYHEKTIGVVPNALVAHDRVFKGNVKAYNKYGPLSTLISLHANPLYNPLSIRKDRIVAHLVFLRDIIKLLLCLEIRRGIEQIRNYFLFWCKVPKIYRSVKCNRKMQNNWLNLC